MTDREKIIEVANVCGLCNQHGGIDAFPDYADELEAFYHAAQADAFEQAAAVCETDGIGAKYQGDVYAVAIRALKEK